jgi:N6-L-threonylcarbamoyladenine synthase
MPAGTLPRAWLRESYDFSFSGIKTAVLHKVQERQELAARMPTAPAPERKPPRGRAAPAASGAPPPAAPPAPLDPVFVGQIAYAFQESVVDVLTAKAAEAATRYGATAILLAGGVAANLRLREELARRASVPVRYPPLELCTDNAAMVAAAAYYRFAAGAQSGWALDVVPNLRLGG